MHLIATVIGIPHARFHCNRLTTVRDIQDYVILIFWGTHCSDLQIAAIQFITINRVGVTSKDLHEISCIYELQDKNGLC